MYQKLAAFLRLYGRALLALVVAVCATRVYEYYLVAFKSFVPGAVWFELAGWCYDVWACLLYAAVLVIPCSLVALMNRKAAMIVLHACNTIMLIAYLSLIIVYSERNTPFDHELFTRSLQESWLTTRQMMTSGPLLYIPFLVIILVYYIFYFRVFVKTAPGRKWLMAWLTATVLSIVLVRYANPPEKWFRQKAAYYFTANKFSYWVADIINYFNTRDQFDASRLSKEELDAEIDFYQQQQPFHFTSKEYPLLHADSSHDVLGSFFNLGKTPPNIVILVVEGLSRDFSGDKAYAGSFTPFLDSLSKQGLTWDNFLSTAPGTFAAHPAISGSLPYGKRGFSVINTMPDHLSLIKILRANGYHSKFLIGFNPDFDNMGGYMRLQGTDMILSKYPSKYKEMGVGSEGWSMGYPDDALFSRSFEVMDSLPHQPYLNIYHTATTHMPYLFEQQKEYAKKFDQKMRGIPNTNRFKKTLLETKEVLVTYMFADDCFRDFFAKYANRPDYNNTIFFITGDHHIGSFPSTCGIDDYHVPLIVYSPMLKAPRKFYSVNTHNNLAPTINALIAKNYTLSYQPKEVHWLTGVMDTATRFRNIQSMPFMEWSREITDYIWKDYYLSGTELYKMTPDLLEEKVNNDSIKQHMIRLRDNFRIINSYVCDNNRIIPQAKAMAAGQRDLLLDHYDPSTHSIFTKSSDTTIAPEFAVPKQYRYLYVELAAEINLRTPGIEDQPSFRMAMIDTSKHLRNFLFWTHHNITQLAKGDYIEHQWNNISTSDMFTLSDYKGRRNLVFDLSFYTQVLPMNLQFRNLRLKVYGVK